MTQLEYDVIMRIITNGAPAIASDLCYSFAKVVSERNSFKRELEILKQKKPRTKKPKEIKEET